MLDPLASATLNKWWKILVMSHDEKKLDFYGWILQGDTKVQHLYNLSLLFFSISLSFASAPSLHPSFLPQYREHYPSRGISYQEVNTGP